MARWLLPWIRSANHCSDQGRGCKREPRANVHPSFQEMLLLRLEQRLWALRCKIGLIVRSENHPITVLVDIAYGRLGAVSGPIGFASMLGFGSFTMFFSVRLIHNSKGNP